MEINKFACMVIASLVITGCAGRASSVAPANVSAEEYSGMSCDATRAERSSARDKNNSLTRKQNNAATMDAASVVLVLLPLGSVFGGDVSGELAQAKGELAALERAVRINCRTEAVSTYPN